MVIELKYSNRWTLRGWVGSDAIWRTVVDEYGDATKGAPVNIAGPVNHITSHNLVSYTRCLCHLFTCVAYVTYPECRKHDTVATLLSAQYYYTVMKYVTLARCSVIAEPCTRLRFADLHNYITIVLLLAVLRCLRDMTTWLWIVSNALQVHQSNRKWRSHRAVKWNMKSLQNKLLIIPELLIYMIAILSLACFINLVMRSSRPWLYLFCVSNCCQLRVSTFIEEHGAALLALQLPMNRWWCFIV